MIRSTLEIHVQKHSMFSYQNTKQESNKFDYQVTRAGSFCLEFACSVMLASSWSSSFILHSCTLQSIYNSYFSFGVHKSIINSQISFFSDCQNMHGTNIWPQRKEFPIMFIFTFHLPLSLPTQHSNAKVVEKELTNQHYILYSHKCVDNLTYYSETIWLKINVKCKSLESSSKSQLSAFSQN